jgi:hypothetical protein
MKSLDVKTLGQTVVTLLGLRPGEDVEIQRDRHDNTRLMIIRHPMGAHKEGNSG